MPDDSVYIVRADGHFSGVEELDCAADDQEAIRKAQRFADDHDVELWERGRFVSRLAATKP